MADPFVRALFGTERVHESNLQSVYETFGFYRAPALRTQVAESFPEAEVDDLHVSPLQVALASAALSNHGVMPAPRLATAVNTPNDGWLVLPALGTPFEALPAAAADEAAASMMVEGESYWAHIGLASGKESPVTWFIGGTPPNWQASPLIVVVALEQENERLAQRIGQELLIDALNP